MSKIEVKNIYKIFGPHPKKWLEAAQGGMSKEQLLAESGHTLGLRDISLSIEEGSIYVIMGLSGSGKSTLIRHFNRLIEPSAGHILVDGVDVVSLNKRDLEIFRQKKMSMVFQRFGLFPHRTVLDNAAYGLTVQGVGRAEREKRARDWLEQVGLSGFENQYPHQLSGGMQQRVALCRALIHDPDILLMDEPFGALDAMTREAMNLELQRVWLESRKTVMFITHSISEAVFLSDRVVVMSKRPGRVALTIDVDLPRPRDYTMVGHPDFVKAATAIRECFDAAGMTE